jgi:hypothetical protein
MVFIGVGKHTFDKRIYFTQDVPWKSWALQIGTALHSFHIAENTHMDIKTSNVVAVVDGNGKCHQLQGNDL